MLELLRLKMLSKLPRVVCLRFSFLFFLFFPPNAYSFVYIRVHTERTRVKFEGQNQTAQWWITFVIYKVLRPHQQTAARVFHHAREEEQKQVRTGLTE